MAIFLHYKMLQRLDKSAKTLIFKLVLCINILVWYRYMNLWCNVMFLVTINFKIYSNQHTWESSFKLIQGKVSLKSYTARTLMPTTNVSINFMKNTRKFWSFQRFYSWFKNNVYVNDNNKKYICGKLNRSYNMSRLCC